MLLATRGKKGGKANHPANKKEKGGTIKEGATEGASATLGKTTFLSQDQLEGRGGYAELKKKEKGQTPMEKRSGEEVRLRRAKRKKYHL